MKHKCSICGKEFYQITSNHLKCHGITRTEYIKAYGLEGVQNTSNIVVPNRHLTDTDTYESDRHLRIQKSINK